MNYPNHAPPLWVKKERLSYRIKRVIAWVIWWVGEGLYRLGCWMERPR